MLQDHTADVLNLDIQVITELYLSQEGPSKEIKRGTYLRCKKIFLPSDWVIEKLPEYQSFGRQSKLRLDPQYIPNLKWEPPVAVKLALHLLHLNKIVPCPLQLVQPLPP